MMFQVSLICETCDSLKIHERLLSRVNSLMNLKASSAIAGEGLLQCDHSCGYKGLIFD